LNQQWFEMMDVRKRRLDDAVWIPLRASCQELSGEHGHLGYKAENFIVSSVSVPLKKRSAAEQLGWGELNLMHHHKGSFHRNKYVPSDIFLESGIGQGILLALAQGGNAVEPRMWHLHQDLAITLGLKREGDSWLAMDEGYIEVARLCTDPSGLPRVLEIRAEHLKDYLCARRLALYVSSYRSREEVVDDPSHITWTGNPFRPEKSGRDRWEGRVVEIHEGGMPFGGTVAVFQALRTDVDFGEDVPRISLSGEDVVSKSWTKKFEGRKLHHILGELWRTEWVEPAAKSPRVRGDKLRPSVFFITDSSGTRESSETLEAGRRWLWFRPAVMMELTERRGGALGWYTRDTGSVRCSPDFSVHFGVNKLGLVNVYAKDIALLPEWQQQLWVGFNVGPEGGVSEELLAAQAQGEPADTQAPEEHLSKVIELINRVGMQNFGVRLFREHEQFAKILSRTHRFRSIDWTGFCSLAKDLARLTADGLDQAELQKIAVLSKDQKLGSLKLLEKVLAQKIGTTRARSLLGPLHGVYNLRHADAHLPGSELEAALELTQIDKTMPFVLQGFQLLYSCVSALYAIADELGKPKN
jgi:hypothetical protein